MSLGARHRVPTLLFLLAAAGARLPAAEHHLTLLLDLRLQTAEGEPSWTEGGLGKLRFDRDDEPWQLGAALLDYRGRLRSTLEARVVAGIYDSVDHPLDLHEAFLVYRTVPRSPLRLELRAGAFAAPFSLENTGPAWTSPYTITSSAINSWFGEELRTIGLELDGSWMERYRGSPHDFGVTAALFTANDPAGALISWRGWALHDRQTRLFERLPLADLPAFRPTGSFPPQEALRRAVHRDRPPDRLLHRDSLGLPPDLPATASPLRQPR